MNDLEQRMHAHLEQCERELFALQVHIANLKQLLAPPQPPQSFDSTEDVCTPESSSPPA